MVCTYPYSDVYLVCGGNVVGAKSSKTGEELIDVKIAVSLLSSCYRKEHILCQTGLTAK